MDHDRRDLINHLFALATGLLEDAASKAIEGQSPKLLTADCIARADDLHRSAQQLAALAKTINVIADLKN